MPKPTSISFADAARLIATGSAATVIALAGGCSADGRPQPTPTPSRDRTTVQLVGDYYGDSHTYVLFSSPDSPVNSLAQFMQLYPDGALEACMSVADSEPAGSRPDPTSLSLAIDGNELEGEAYLFAGTPENPITVCVIVRNYAQLAGGVDTHLLDFAGSTIDGKVTAESTAFTTPGPSPSGLVLDLGG